MVVKGFTAKDNDDYNDVTTVDFVELGDSVDDGPCPFVPRDDEEIPTKTVYDSDDDREDRILIGGEGDVESSQERLGDYDIDFDIEIPASGEVGVPGRALRSVCGSLLTQDAGR